jgi:hypothetical protein
MPKPIRLKKRIVVRYQIKRVDGQLWAQAFDVGNNRFVEADFYGTGNLEVQAECTRRINSGFSINLNKIEEI